MRKGQIAEMGTYDELVAKGVDFQQFVAPEKEEEEEPKPEHACLPASMNGSALGLASPNFTDSQVDTEYLNNLSYSTEE